MNAVKNKDTFDNKYLMVWYDNLKGVQLDHDNAQAVAKWVGANASVSRIDGVNKVIITTNRGDIILEVGDYITIDADKRFKIVRIAEADLTRPAIANVMSNTPKPSDIRRVG